MFLQFPLYKSFEKMMILFRSIPRDLSAHCSKGQLGRPFSKYAVYISGRRRKRCTEMVLHASLSKSTSSKALFKWPLLQRHGN